MRLFNSERRIFLVSCLLMLLSLFALAQTAVKEQANSRSEEFLRFSSVMSEAYEIIRQKYVDEPKPDKVFEAAIQGMFTALDDHSQFLDADSYEQVNKETEGGFSGIGIHISMRNGLLTVIAPIPGSPVARLGVMPWDRIIKIEGEDTKGMTLQDAVRKLTGVPGTKVKVTFYRPADQRAFDLTVTRANVKVDSVYSKMLDGEIGYARVTKFANDTSGDVKRALLNFHKKGARGLILDLRFDTGGLLKEAIAVSDLFLKKGLAIVSTKGRDPDQNKEYKSTHDPVTRLPLIVLVNNGSASASEIVAAAIQENDRGILVGPKGQRTFGKWSVQTIEELRHSLDYDKEGNPRRCAVRLTTARYYSPKGKTYHGEGLKFDEEVELPKDHERDLFTQGHLLGDPNMIESKTTELDHFPTKGEIEGTTPTKKAPKPLQPSPESNVRENPEEESPVDKKVEPAAPEQQEENEGVTTPTLQEDMETSPSTSGAEGATSGTAQSSGPFHDLLLDHAVHLLKAHIRLAGTKAA